MGSQQSYASRRERRDVICFAWALYRNHFVARFGRLQADAVAGIPLTTRGGLSCRSAHLLDGDRAQSRNRLLSQIS